MFWNQLLELYLLRRNPESFQILEAFVKVLQIIEYEYIIEALVKIFQIELDINPASSGQAIRERIAGLCQYQSLGAIIYFLF